MKGKPKGIRTLVTVVSLVLIALITLSLAGCANTTPSPTSTSISATTPVQVADKSIEIVFTTHENQNTVFHKDVFEPWFNEIEKRTGGKVKFKPHWGGELVNIMDSYDAVTRGTVDMAHVFPQMVAGKFPIDEINAFLSYDTYCYKPSSVYWELYKKYPEMGAQYSDVKLITLGSFMMTSFGTTKKPITKLEDLKGLKTISSGKWVSARLEALGIIPVSIPPQDCYMALQTGTVDATAPPIYLLEDWKYVDVFQHVVLVNTFGNPFGVLMNKNTWNKLPPDVQKVFEEMGEEFVATFDSVMYKVEEQRLADARAKYTNIQFSELPTEELSRWVQADKPVFDAFAAELEAKGLPGKNLQNDFLQLEKKYASPEYQPK